MFKEQKQRREYEMLLTDSIETETNKYVIANLGK